MTGFSRNPAMEYRPATIEQQQLPQPYVHASAMLGAAQGGGTGGGGHEMLRRNPLQAIWMRRWIVVLCVILALAGGVVYYYRSVPLYRAQARVYVEQTGPKLTANDTASMPGTSNFLNTQAQVILSPVNLEKVAANPEIQNLASFRNASDLLNSIRNVVGAEVGRRDDIITISATVADADDAAKIANAVLTAYEEYIYGTRQQSAVEMAKLLQRGLDEREAELKGLYEKRVEFQRRNPGLSLGAKQGNAVLERLNQLSSALTQAQMEKLELTATYEATKAMMNDPVKIAQLMSAPGFRGGENGQLRAELRQLQQQMASASASYLPGYSGLQSLQNNIKRLNDDLAAEDKKAAEAYLAELEAKRAAAERREAQIAQYLRDQQAEVLKLNSVEADYGLIDAEVGRLERLTDDLSQRLKELDLTKSIDRALHLHIVERARPQREPVEPNRASVMFKALVIGLGLGIGLAFLRELTDQRLRSADEIKMAMGLPILGVVPHITGTRSPSQRGLQLHLDPMSDVAESYRTVRTAVYFGVPQGTAKTILVTSPSPGDGKTTLASNLAVAMAQAGNRVLLLDADFRKPMQHRIFDLPSKTGLSTVLAGDTPLDQAIVQTNISGLHVLPCGPIPANPSEILNSQMFADVLDELIARYDHVILDSPPVMPVTDARILAASADATLLALRAEKTTRKGAVYARDVLRSVGARILGVVVNDVPRRKGVYGYYYTDADTYTYGYTTSGRHNGSSRKALPKSPQVVEGEEVTK